MHGNKTCSGQEFICIIYVHSIFHVKSRIQCFMIQLNFELLILIPLIIIPTIRKISIIISLIIKDIFISYISVIFNKYLYTHTSVAEARVRMYVKICRDNYFDAKSSRQYISHIYISVNIHLLKFHPEESFSFAEGPDPWKSFADRARES